MTAIVKKIKVGLSQEEIDELKPSVIDLGMITEDPASTTNSVLNAAVTPGNLYKFTKLGYSADGFSQVYFMFVSAQFQGNSSTPAIYQLIKPGFNTNTTYVRIRSTSGTWSASTESLATEEQNFAAQKYAASGDTSSKLFLIGRTSQSTYGGITYSHDTVYVDTDGHLYDSGKRVLTTADSVGGGTSEDIADLKENGYYSVSNTMPDDEKAQWNVGNVDSDLQLIGKGDRPTYYSESGGSQEVAFLSDLVGSDVAQSVIDLGTISSSFQSSVCEDLDGLTETGIYTFKYGNTCYMMNVEKVQTGATTYSTFQYIYTKPDVYFTRINNGTSWSYFGAKYLVDSTDSVTSGNISNKIFLVGRTSQSITGGTAYSHDTVYVDTDGHLYDSGNRVLTTADNVGGGAVSGDYLPYYTVTLTNDTTPMSTVLSAYGNGLYAITFDGPASGKYIFNVQHQGGTRYGMSAIDINTNAISYYDSEDMSTVTATDFKNSFTSFLKTTGGTITGDLSVAGNLKLNNTRTIVHGNDLYEYTFPKKSGTVALLSDIQNETKLHVYETSNKVHNKDFHQVMLYALQNAPEEMPFAIRLIVGYSGSRYQFIGVKKNLGTTHRVYLLDLKTYYTYKSNEFHYKTDYSTITLDDITISMSRLIEGIPTSLAGFSSASAGIYGTTLTSGLYSFNCLLDDGSYLNFTMDLNKDASYTQVSPIIKDWGEGAFERLSYYKGTLKYVDQDGQPLSSYNTIQIRRLYSY